MRRFVVVTWLASQLALANAQASPGSSFEEMVSGMGGAFYTGDELYRKGRDHMLGLGYVAAIHDGDLTARPIAGNGTYCVPRGVSNGQLLDVAWQFMDQNPAKRHLHAAHLVRESWRAAWPCASKQ